MSRWGACVVVAAAAAALLAGSLAGCGGGSKRKARVVRPVVERDLPPVLRGTIGSETSLRGAEPQLVSGFGVVVGLAGTGGGELPVQVQAHMERELARGGVGRGTEADMMPGLKNVSPRSFVRDPNVAVVIVEAAIPPGAPKGMPFDVRVRTLPGSSVTSLEGGQLWTTELRLGPATVAGGVRTRVLAEGRGAIYINPFADPANAGVDSVSRTVGRVLGGGVVTQPLRMELVLDNPSHSRARSIVAAVNQRFPEGAGDTEPTATGRTDESIAIRVPAEFRERSGEFIALLRHTRIDQSFPHEWARRYVESLKNQPVLADDISWALQSVGKTALPFCATLYDYPELAPRMAALRAGAKLGDARAAPHLAQLARTGLPATRTEAIELLGELRGVPIGNLALRDLVSEPALDVRVSAYEALRKLRDPAVRSYAVGPDPYRPKFRLDLVISDDPMIYVTQQGEPRIVLFGPNQQRLVKPLLVGVWGERLMLAADAPEDDVRMYYRDFRTGEIMQVPKAEEELVKLIRYMAQKPTPEDPTPGMGLTFSEIVGALYEIQRQGALAASFATERDKLLGDLLRAAETTAVRDRPETNEREPEETRVVFEPTPESQAPVAEQWRPRVVPLGRPAPEAAKKKD